MDIDTIREVRFLNYFNHPNIVNVNVFVILQIYEIFIRNPKQPKEQIYKSLYIVMDYMVPLAELIYDFDKVFALLIHNKVEMTPSDIKLIIAMILRGL